MGVFPIELCPPSGIGRPTSRPGGAFPASRRYPTQPAPRETDRPGSPPARSIRLAGQCSRTPPRDRASGDPRPGRPHEARPRLATPRTALGIITGGGRRRDSGSVARVGLRPRGRAQTARAAEPPGSARASSLEGVSPWRGRRAARGQGHDTRFPNEVARHQAAIPVSGPQPSVAAAIGRRRAGAGVDSRCPIDTWLRPAVSGALTRLARRTSGTTRVPRLMVMDHKPLRRSRHLLQAVPWCQREKAGTPTATYQSLPWRPGTPARLTGGAGRRGRSRAPCAGRGSPGR
jgi:hypothetical protein